MGIKDNGNGSFVLDLTTGTSEGVHQEEKPKAGSSSVERKKKVSARAARSQSGGGPDGPRMCVWLDAESVRAFRAAKMVYENTTGQPVTNGVFLLALLDGEWDNIPSSAKKFYKDFIEMSKKQ